MQSLIKTLLSESRKDEANRGVADVARLVAVFIQDQHATWLVTALLDDAITLHHPVHLFLKGVTHDLVEIAC